MAGDVFVVSRSRLAEQINGGLDLTTKVPCPSCGICAYRCRIGSVPAKKPGSTCESCCARRDRYLFTNVQATLEARYRGLFHPLWTPAVLYLVRWYCDRYFRWFDSSGLQGEDHFRNTCTVAEHTPDVRHSSPTRELETVQKEQEFPTSLPVPVSAARVDGEAPRSFPNVGTAVSHPTEASPEAILCPAPEIGGACRQCWIAGQESVMYRLHGWSVSRYPVTPRGAIPRWRGCSRSRRSRSLGDPYE